ncbi:unnamed protein product [Gongylonema pulchrum]|uniref:Fibronectin type-III domain-containing protein n=1 Tax=Gongylonema pulchrum TaxID=637853 RepID=A0A183ERH4_9BILA|nr:unnamed protein product [Gongylonema pulchrum]
MKEELSPLDADGSKFLIFLQQSISDCENQCSRSITDDDLCGNKTKNKDKEFCWRTCGGILNEGPQPKTPSQLSWTFTPSYAIDITWHGDGTFFLLELSAISENQNERVENIIITTASLKNYTKSAANFCKTLLFRVASVTSGGVSDYSDAHTISAPAPEITSNVTVHSMEYILISCAFFTYRISVLSTVDIIPTGPSSWF